MSQSSSTEQPETGQPIILEDAPSLSEQVPAFVDLLPEQLRPYWHLLQQYPLLEAAIILGIFWLIALLIRRYAIGLMYRLTQRTNSQLDDHIIDELRSPCYSSVIWFGLIVASKSAGFESGVFVYLAPFASTMIVLSLLRALLNISSLIISALAREDSGFKKIDARTEPLLVIASKLVLLVVGAYITLVIWGINPLGLIASAGIVGIAVGFAAKDTLANLFSGVFILADRPYKLGDYINLDSGERGMVTHIGIRSTRILTRDDIEITIPNGVIGNAKVVNESGGNHVKMRVRLDVECAYDADLDVVEEVLMSVADDEPDICAHPAPRVRVRGFASSGISIQLMGWIEQPRDRGRIMHKTYKAIHGKFAEHNLEIPYPHRSITILKED